MSEHPHITARVTCTSKQVPGWGGEGSATLHFTPDYQADRNKEWAAATPNLSVTITVNGTVADQFERGWNYELTFTRHDDELPGVIPVQAAASNAEEDDSAASDRH